MKVSKVSVSRSAAPPQRGQVVSMNESIFLIGEPMPSNSTSSGNTTGKSASGTGSMPHASQWMTGIGAPQ